MLKMVPVFLFFILLFYPRVYASDVQLIQTGQNGCYDDVYSAVDCRMSPAQDGAVQAGKPWIYPRFVNNDNGTVTDTMTGVTWLWRANCAGPMNWADALAWTSRLATGICGLSDGSVPGQWRLPNRNELASLANMELRSWDWSDVYIFYDVQSYYWSSTTYAPDKRMAWEVGVNFAVSHESDKSSPSYVWPVRENLN